MTRDTAIAAELTAGTLENIKIGDPAAIAGNPGQVEADRSGKRTRKPAPCASTD
jgi:hypothetical protein